MTASWQKQRSRFNHDWLKNRYLPAVAKWINILDELVEDPAFEDEFLRSILPQWEQQSRHALDLVDAFTREMSPERLMGQTIFSNFSEESRRWLGPLLHELWLSRYPVAEWQFNARDAILKSISQYSEIKMTPKPQQYTRLEKEETRNQFVAFQNCCHAVARSIEVFPSKLLIA
jgi:hypothetical protein